MARNLMSDEEWGFSKGSFWRSAAPLAGRRWTLAGIWELILDVLNESGAAPDTVQMIDSTIVRAHHCAAGAKRGLIKRILAVRKVVSRPRSTSGPTPEDCR